MKDHWLTPTVLEVKLDLSRLKGESDGNDTRYVVALNGPPREDWIETYRELSSGAASTPGFELDAAQGAVRFTCRSVDGTGVVFEALEALENLIERVNQIAAARRAAPPRLSVPPSALRAR